MIGISLGHERIVKRKDGRKRMSALPAIHAF